MRICLLLLGLVCASCGVSPSKEGAGGERATEIRSRGHSHNDYTRARPLLDALEWRFGSIEADVFLVEGELLVAHDRERCRPERTLTGMYLEPLIARARANAGTIYKGRREALLLFIDIKADGVSAYRAIDERLRAAADVFTEYDRGVVIPRAVTVVISGDIPRAEIAGQDRRFAFVDGRRPDLESTDAVSPALVPVVSMAWNSVFRWRGLGEMPLKERELLRSLVGAAHERGHRIRFWGVPPLEHVWEVLLAEGVDLLNVDDLERASRTLDEFARGSG